MTPVLRLYLFGAFSASVGDLPMTRSPSPKMKTLLALLALRQGREVSRAWIAETLWPDSSRDKALFNLRQLLAGLRRSLGPAAVLLHSPDPLTLCLNRDGVIVDVARFDAALADASTAALEEAIALYRGPLLEGWTQEWAVTERTAREQAYLTALETLADRARARSDSLAAIHRLRQIVAADPYRESAHRALMQALADHGDYPAVTQVYRDLRLTLHRDLNAAPDAETDALYRRLQQQAKAPVAPPALPPDPALPPRRIPIPLTPLIGRRMEAEAVTARLRDGRLVTLTGVGGVGKTRLAIAVAEEMSGEFPGGRWLVELAPQQSPGLVIQAVADALRLREESGRPQIDTLVAYLRDRQALLVLDNAEHLLEACARLVQTALSECAALRILTTSRQPLGIPGEAVFRVPSLSVPGTDDRWETLLEYEAPSLFVARASAAQPAFRLNPENAPAVARISRRLDGIPLAIELAAARLRSMTVHELDRRIENRFALLTVGPRAAPARHQTLRALIDWSYDLLDEKERTLLRRLSVFSGGWTLAAAEGVCSGGLIEAGEVLDLLAALVDKNLVLAEVQGETTRYRFLETIRQYSRERLGESGEESSLRHRHLDYFLALADDAVSLQGHHVHDSLAVMDDHKEECEEKERQPERLAGLDEEHDNLRAALDWCEEDPAPSQIHLRFVHLLGSFWYFRGRYREGRERLLAALAASDPNEQKLLRAHALDGLAAMTNYLGLPGAGACYEEALVLYRELGEEDRVARVTGALGLLAIFSGDFARAVAQTRESIALFQKRGDLYWVQMNYHLLTYWHYFYNDFEGVRRIHEEAIAYCGATSALTREMQGLLCLDEEDLDAALPLLEGTLQTYQELLDHHNIAKRKLDLGLALAGRGAYDRARSLLRESLLALWEMQEMWGLWGCLEAVAFLSWARDGSLDAPRLWGAAAAVRGEGVWFPVLKSRYERQSAPVRAALGAEGFEALWAEGRALSAEQAVKYALRVLGP